ncbi:hypothetical protein BGZ50_008841 [Haplosporangium sp. Z 11]|nr:hypothetical protein BGZ50_008841 [Haplosporangium sp. Z 11]
MAANSHHTGRHLDHFVHDSEGTSDSNEEFASASEGDDDLPWEPVVIRSPALSRQSPQWSSPSTEQTPQPAHATLAPSYQGQPQEAKQVQEQESEQGQEREQAQEVREAVQTHQRQHSQDALLYDQHHHPRSPQQILPIHQEQQHSLHDGSLQTGDLYHQSTRSSSSSSSWTSHSHSYSNQSHSQSQNFQHEYSSTTITRTRSQQSPSQSQPRGSAPKLRERMRQSPLLHSKIVQAYLDPNASPHRHQQTTSDFVRQAWLQDGQQESSEYDTEEEEEEENLVDQRVPEPAPTQGYSQSVTSSAHAAHIVPVVPIVQEFAVVQTTGLNTDTLSQEDQQQAEESWGFDEKIDIEETMQTNQMESSWGFDAPIDIDESTVDQPQPTISESSASLEETNVPHIHHVHEVDEDAWGYDDQLADLVKADIHGIEPSPTAIDMGTNQVSHRGDDVDDIEAGEPVVEDKNPFASPEDDLYMDDSSKSLEEDNIRASTTIEDVESVHQTERPHSIDAEDSSHQEKSIASEPKVTQEVLFDAVIDSATHQLTPDEPIPEAHSHYSPAGNEDVQMQSRELHMGVSNDVETMEEEASWGFDMDEVIDIGLDDEAEQSTDQHVESYGYNDNIDQQPSSTVKENEVVDAMQDQDTAPATISAAVKQERTAADAESGETSPESDNEHDSEVREILQAAQCNPFIESDNGHHSSTAFTSSISERDHLTSSEATESISYPDEPSHSDQQGESYPSNAPVSSQQPLTSEPAHEFKMSATVPPDVLHHSLDFKSTGSDSEGSDIYGDLSTARTGISASSNRLNEILEDDDYLEHMERGLPMNRSISTPYSDEESPKFIVDDHLVELMERGETLPKDDEPFSLLEDGDGDQDQDQNGTDAEPSFHDHEIDSTNLAASFTLALGASNTVASVISAPYVTPPDTTVVSEIATPATPDLYTVFSHHKEKESMTDKDSSEIAQPEPAVPSKLEDVASVATVTDTVSDDQDPANPFSDAAAVDDQDDWPAVNQPIEQPITEHTPMPVHEQLQVEEQPVARSETSRDAVINSDSQGSKTEVDVLEAAIDENIQDDAWDDQGLDIVVESTPAWKEPISTKEVVVNDAGKEEVTDTAVEMVNAREPEPLTDACHTVEAPIEDDAWIDQDANIVADSLHTREHDGKEELLEDIEQPAEEHLLFQQHEPANSPTAEPEQQVTSPSLQTRTDQIVDEILASHPPCNPLEAGLDEDAWDEDNQDIVFDSAITDAHPPSQATVVIQDVANDRPLDLSVTKDQNTTFAIDAEPEKPSSPFNNDVSAHHGVEVDNLDRSIGAVEDEDPWTAQNEDDVAKPVVTVAVIHQAEEPVPAPCKDDDSEDHIAPRIQRLSDQENTSLSHIIDNVLEEDAWGEQEAGLTADISLAISGHEATVATTVIKQEEVQTIATIQNIQEPEIDADLANSIDAAIEDDAWDDQDVNVGTALDFVQEAASLPKSITKDEHLGHTSHPDAIQEPHLAQPHMGLDEHKMDIKLDDAIDAAIEKDAWGDQDVDLGVIDDVVHEPAHSLEFADKIDHHEHVSGPVPVPDVIQEPHMQQSDHGLDIKLIDAEVEDDAWGDQDINIEITNDIVQVPVQLFGSETENDRSEYVPRLNIRQEEQQMNTNLGEAIDVAIKEDMWADQKMDLTITSELHTTLQSATIATSVADSYSITHTHASDDARDVHERSFEDVIEPNHQTSLAACNSSLAKAQVFSHEEPKADILLDDAIDEDAWADQDLDFAIETVTTDVPVVETVEKNDIHPPHSTAITTVIAESQENTADEIKARPLSSSSPKIGSVLQHSYVEQPEEVTADAWGWDEDEVGVHLERQNEAPSLRSKESPSLSKVDKQEEPADIKQDSEHTVEKAAVVEEATSTSSGSVLAPAIGIPARISPLAIRKDHAVTSPGNSSGDGDEDIASQSPWQDVSPASVSKRSEGGLSIGSGIESEFSVRSLDDDGHVSSKQSEEGNMSWTELKQDRWQTGEHHGISVDKCRKDIAGSSSSLMDATAIIEGPLIETQTLPDLTGADSWDFDQEDDLMSSFSEHTPISTKTNVPRNLRTPDMDVRRFVPHLDTHSKASHASSLTPSSSRVLSSHQSSTAGSVPPSPIQSVTNLSATAPTSPLSATSTPTATATEVEDDSHLPLAIRQQRARLAARGKPLPPISKYKSTKDTASSSQSSTVLSPRLSAPTSPLISSALLDKSPGSPIRSVAAVPPPVSEQKFLSPALQKQRERLEKKRAAAAATPLSAARRLTVTEPPTDYTPSSTKPTSPLVAQATLSSTLKHTLTSPTLSRKSVQLTTESVSTLANDDYDSSSRRRGSSVSSHGHAPFAVPSSPLTERFASRRSRDIGRPKLMGGQQEADVVRTSQSNAYRYTSSTSISSSTMSGWDDAFEDEDQGQDQDASSTWKTSTATATPKSKERKEPPASLFMSTSSSSFYQQTVPGLDDGSEGRFEASTGLTSSSVMTSSSGYLSSKKVDEYDPYGPKIGSGDAGKAKKSFEESSFTKHNEVLIGRSSPVSNVSLLSPTSATSVSHRHDHHNNSTSNSLLGDITSILHEKNSAIHENRKPASSTLSPIPSSSSSSNVQKSSSWSFGSWVSSAVAVATDTIDKAYESLDPEYSRMKARSGHGGPASESAYLGMDDPDSLSPYKKPGYVVGGSSLALGLASISTGGPGSTSPSQQPAAAQQPQQQQQHYRQASPAPSPSPSASPALGFGSSGQSNTSGGGYAAAGSASDTHAHHISHVEREQKSLSSRVTRKHVSGR